MTLEEFGTRAISVPYKERGRDWSGWDCWGLVTVFQKEMFSIDVGDFSAEYKPDASFEELSKLIERELPDWQQIQFPMFGDVALYRVGRFPSHVGLIFPFRHRTGILHCEAKIGTVIEPIDTRVWVKRIEGYYRHHSRF